MLGKTFTEWRTNAEKDLEKNSKKADAVYKQKLLDSISYDEGLFVIEIDLATEFPYEVFGILNSGYGPNAVEYVRENYGINETLDINSIKSDFFTP